MIRSKYASNSSRKSFFKTFVLLGLATAVFLTSSDSLFASPGAVGPDRNGSSSGSSSNKKKSKKKKSKVRRNRSSSSNRRTRGTRSRSSRRNRPTARRTNRRKKPTRSRTSSRSSQSGRQKMGDKRSINQVNRQWNKVYNRSALNGSRVRKISFNTGKVARPATKKTIKSSQMTKKSSRKR